MHFLRYTLENVNRSGNSGALVDLDVSKVIDRFEHYYLVSVLVVLGLDPVFCS